MSLATEITKAKSAAYELSLFGSVLDVNEIEVE